MEAQREYDCRFALDFEYARAHNYWKDNTGFPFTPCQAFEFLHAGALTSAFCASLSPAFIDLRQDGWTQDRATPLFVTAAISMSAEKQARLVRFLASGGRALIAPLLPVWDENLEPCTHLLDFLGLPVNAFSLNPGKAVRLNIAGVVNVLANGSVFFADHLPKGAQILGLDEFSGCPVAWKLGTPGGGQLIFLGMSWAHAMHEHHRMLATLLSDLGLRPKIACDNPNLWSTLWTAGNRSLLFALNLFTAPLEADWHVHPAWTNTPLTLGRRAIPPVTVMPVAVRPSKQVFS